MKKLKKLFSPLELAVIALVLLGLSQTSMWDTLSLAADQYLSNISSLLGL
ncbi:MAG: hypothetical protein Q8P35_01390 [Candidatus Yanofskybacteria bacterium]|nr:hypothetical protein [Candidatus Yanofskybacteria bacterium]